MTWFKRRQEVEPGTEALNILDALVSGQMTILVGNPLTDIPRWAYNFNYQNMPHIAYLEGVLAWDPPKDGYYPVMVHLAIEDGAMGYRRVLMVCDPQGTSILADLLHTEYFV